MHLKHTICEIEHGSAAYWATVELRDAVLRKPLGLQFSAAELAAENSSCHLAFYCDDRLAACLMLCPLTGGDVQMRQVAVAPDLQRHGIGRALVMHAENRARRQGYRRIVLHARETAVPFYEKLGYSRVGGRFEAVTLPHCNMEKQFSLPQAGELCDQQAENHQDGTCLQD